MSVVLNGRRETLSQSKSLKADKELMWKKLSTPYITPIDADLAYFQKALWRGLRRGQMNVAVAKSGCGKSVYMDSESTG